MGRDLPAVRLAPMLLMAALAGGCATKSDVRDVRMDVRSAVQHQDSVLRVMERDLREADRATQDSLRAAMDMLFEFRGEVNNQLATALEQLLLLGELAGQGQRSLAGIRDQLDAQRWEPARAATPTETPFDSVGQADEEADPVASDPATETYEAAVRQVNLGSFTVARMAFARFLEEHPNHALAPGAYLHLGELASLEDQLQAALDAYLRVPELFPVAEEVPDALYRAAMIFIEMEDFGRAREILERIANSYSGHRFAAMAEERLRELP